MSIADKLSTIAENEQKVYDAGYAKGKAEGGDRSFANSLIDRSITKLTADNLRDLTFIGADAFLECYWLKEVELPDNITMIKYWAFRHCSKLPEIIIPPKLTLIGTAAFYGCEALRIVDLTRFGRNDPFPTLEADNAFEYLGEYSKIVVPIGRKAELSEMTNWSSWYWAIAEVSEVVDTLLKSEWKFNDRITSCGFYCGCNVTFVDGFGNTYASIEGFYENIPEYDIDQGDVYYTKSDGEMVVAYSNGWIDEKYKTIKITDTSGAYDKMSLYNWLNADGRRIKLI